MSPGSAQPALPLHLEELLCKPARGHEEEESPLGCCGLGGWGLTPGLGPAGLGASAGLMVSLVLWGVPRAPALWADVDYPVGTLVAPDAAESKSCSDRAWVLPAPS